jgi:multisubunit Na+/H+ antiporter MnhF subunit
VNIWIGASLLLLFCMVPCFWACLRGDEVSRLVGLEAGSVMASLILLLLAVGFGRISFVDLSLTLAFLSFGGCLVFARFLERWL